MVFKVIVAIILIFLCVSLAESLTVNLNPGTGQVLITNWEWIRCDGKELRIWVSEGSISVSGTLVIGK